MRVRLIKDEIVAGSLEWAGTELDVEATEAATLIRRGLAEAVSDSAPAEAGTETNTEDIDNG
jgi:hypothetical protein